MIIANLAFARATAAAWDCPELLNATDDKPSKLTATIAKSIINKSAETSANPRRFSNLVVRLTSIMITL
jgi:hypothetical protein